MAIAKNQHYVFRHYLESWNIPNTQQVFCLIKKLKNVIQTNTTNVGVQRYFYRFPRLSDDDIVVAKLIGSALTSKNTSEDFSKLVNQIIEFYSGRNVFVNTTDAAKRYHQCFKSIIDTNNEYATLTSHNEKYADDHINEGLERRYCHAENAGTYGLDKLHSGDLSFWDDTDERSKFCYFLCNQYFRTKSMRDKLAQGMKDMVNNIRKLNLIDSQYIPNMDGIAQIICDVLEANIVCSDLLFAKTPILLKNTTGTPFITSDQPIVNISKTDDNGKPIDLILYFPITPTSALLLAGDENSLDDTVTKEEANHYNLKIFNLAYEQAYASERNVLEAIQGSKT
ncbi:MAG: DUF4238 domain-containing protein [Candidatus Limiplasma sp.]|nr:DUF4238 domain-containing protein [Candidatus Limiplasma sp.]